MLVICNYRGKIPTLYFRERRDRECHLLALCSDGPRPHPALGDSKALESRRVGASLSSRLSSRSHLNVSQRGHLTTWSEPGCRRPVPLFFSLFHPILSSSLHSSASEVTCLLICFLGDYLSLPTSRQVPESGALPLWLPLTPYQEKGPE